MSGTPFADLIGIEEVAQSDGCVTLAMEVTRAVHNRRGVAHGGALATLADSAMARAARSLGDVNLGGTIDLNMQFIAPGEGRLTCVGRVTHAAGSIAFCQAEVRDAGNSLVAAATATIKLRRKAPGS